MELDKIFDLFIDNIKKLFFPEEWIELDSKFSKFEIFTLLFLDKRKEITMTELVEYINTPMSTATGIVDRLVRNGYVKRERSETDRRIVVLQLSESGSRLISNLKGLILKYINLAIDGLAEEEKQFMISTVFKIMNNLQTKLSPEAVGEQVKEAIRKIDIE